MQRSRVAITHGDPNGIGPEVVLRCLADSRMLKYVDPILVGSKRVLRTHAKRLGMKNLHFRSVGQASEKDALVVAEVASDAEQRVAFGSITRDAGALSMDAVTAAIDMVIEGKVDAIVTAPISKKAIALAGYTDRGHTEFIADRMDSQSHAMMLVADQLRVGLVTGHMSIWDVPKHITIEAITEKVDVIGESLVLDFGIRMPQIAVLGLNPHASDGGVLGLEEKDVILPAIEECRKKGRLTFGPFPADGFFGSGAYRQYDAVLAMYHDQGLVPFKTLTFGSGVNYTAGLPIVRTSPDHGTAFDIAGRGVASPDSVRSALYLAHDIVRQRAPKQL